MAMEEERRGMRRELNSWGIIGTILERERVNRGEFKGV